MSYTDWLQDESDRGVDHHTNEAAGFAHHCLRCGFAGSTGSSAPIQCCAEWTTPQQTN